MCILLVLLNSKHIPLHSYVCPQSLDRWLHDQNICEPLISLVHTSTILLPLTIRRSNIQRSTKHLIYCLIKQTAETPPALLELLCTTPSHGCYHVVCSRYDWHRGESKSLFLPSLHAHIFVSIY